MSDSSAQDDSAINLSTALPAALGLLGGGLAGRALYKRMRAVNRAPNAYLAGVRRKAKDTFTHMSPSREPSSYLGKLLDKYVNYGGDNVIYDTPTNASKTKRIKLKGLVRHPYSASQLEAIGDVNVGSTLSRNKLEILLENKDFENKFFKKHAPSAIARSENLKNYVKKLDLNLKDPNKANASLRKLRAALQKKYPSGFLLKETLGEQSAGMFPTEKTDLGKLLTKYKTQNLDTKALKELKNLDTKYQGDSIAMYKALRENPNYTGRVVDKLVKSPRSVIVQEKLPLAKSDSSIRKFLQPITDDNLSKEMRVHVEGGRVIPGLSSYRYPSIGDIGNKDVLSAGEDFVQKTINKLPKDIRYKQPFAMDVSPLTDGTFRMIESNPSANSGFLYSAMLPFSGAKIRKHYLGNYSKPLSLAASTALGSGIAGTGLGISAHNLNKSPPSESNR